MCGADRAVNLCVVLIERSICVWSVCGADRAVNHFREHCIMFSQKQLPCEMKLRLVIIKCAG